MELPPCEANEEYCSACAGFAALPFWHGRTKVQVRWYSLSLSNGLHIESFRKSIDVHVRKKRVRKEASAQADLRCLCSGFVRICCKRAADLQCLCSGWQLCHSPFTGKESSENSFAHGVYKRYVYTGYLHHSYTGCMQPCWSYGYAEVCCPDEIIVSITKAKYLHHLFGRRVVDNDDCCILRCYIDFDTECSLIWIYGLCTQYTTCIFLIALYFLWFFLYISHIFHYSLL